MKKINLNQSIIYVSSLNYGRTRYAVKVGRKWLFVEIEKNAISAFVKANTQPNFDWSTHIAAAKIPTNFVIDRKFIENIKEIDAAQSLLRKFF